MNNGLTWRVYGITPDPVSEYRFHPIRKWRFDWAWPAKKIAIEIQGGVFIQGRHSRGAGMLKDFEKSNMANKLGWHVYYFTPGQLKKGIAQSFILDVLNHEG